MRALLAAAFCLAAFPAVAASPDAWAAHEAEVAKTCAKASGLAKARTLKSVDFELHSVTRVAGQIASGRMKGTRETMLCLFVKKTRKATVSPVPPDAGW
ncbi:hypothetical protein [Chenggangzhangella methanolivorans]|uniref:Uncharacterized protein n=1 Tax=Chenggangzhangella methanolivorans TaxID=1437009 RepID=A0A9E6UME5_9HYPH|nr:hypothetical protein [Chenggangzhangella methanolivorans]QZN99955.1 hypothetical protein K6K41_25620 [Chenggangzhangella methanolivorans]